MMGPERASGFLSQGIAESLGGIPLQAAGGVPGVVASPVAAVWASAAAAAIAAVACCRISAPPIQATPAAATLPVSALVVSQARITPVAAPLAPVVVAPPIAPAVVATAPVSTLFVARGRQVREAGVPRSAVMAPAIGGPATPMATLAAIPETVALEGVRQAIRWPTDVMTSRSGLESRVSLAYWPRESISGAALLTDAELRQLYAGIFASPDSTFRVAARWESAPVLADVTGTAISVDSSLLDWPAVGAPILIETMAGSYVTTIAALSGHPGASCAITAAHLPPSGPTFPAGTTRVVPLFSLRPNDGQGAARFPVYAGAAQLAGVTADTRTTYGTGATVATALGAALMDRPLIASSADEAIRGSLESIGSDTFGAYATFSPLTTAAIARRRRIGLRTAADRQWLRAFVATVRGRQVAWRLPTWEPDLALASTPGAGATSLIVSSDANYVTTWFPSLAHRAIQVAHVDGSLEYVSVSAAVDNGDGTHTLTISALGGMTSPIAMLSFLELVRFASDELVIQWITGTRAIVDLDVITVRR